MLVIKYKAIKKFEVARSFAHGPGDPVAAEVTASVCMSGMRSTYMLCCIFSVCFLDVVDTKLVIYALY